MTADEIRIEIIKDLGFIKGILLSERQRDIVALSKTMRTITSIEVSEKFDISIQNSSTQLKRLFDCGYLDRIEHHHESGGIEYEYSYRLPDKKSHVKTLSNTAAPKNGEGIPPIPFTNDIDFTKFFSRK